MNTLLSCTYNNCHSLFQNVYDFVSHTENIHMRHGDSRRNDEIDELENSVLESGEDSDSDRFQDRLAAICNQPLKLSGFFRLNPYKSGYTASPSEKKPIALKFINYRKRPSQINTPAIAAKKAAPVKNAELSDAKSVENDAEIRKFHCTVENCKRSYKNSSGLRNHMRSVHNIGAQQSNRANPAPATTSASTISLQTVTTPHVSSPVKTPEPKVQLQFSKQEDVVPSNVPVIGSLATFNAPANRMTSGETIINSPSTPSTPVRSGLRLTPSEENILNRNLTSLSPSTLSRNSTAPSTPSMNVSRLLDGKFKCEFCPKTYKTQANLRKHVADHHTRPTDDTESPTTVRTVLSKQVLRTPAYSNNQLVSSSTNQSQMGTTSTMGSVKNALLNAPPRSPSNQNVNTPTGNVSSASYFTVQSPATQRQLAVAHSSSSAQQSGGAPLPQRTYIQSRAYTTIPAQQGQPQVSAAQQTVYHLQQPVQSGDESSAGLTVSSQAHSSSPRNYGASPVTIVVQSSQPSSSPAQSAAQQSQLVNDPQYQNGANSQVLSRPAAARTFTAQPFYERYQPQPQRRATNKTYNGGALYQQKSVKQLYRQPIGHEYQRVLPTSTVAQSGGRVNAISNPGQTIRVTALGPAQSGNIGSTNHYSAGVPSSAGNSTTTYQSRIDGPRRTSQLGANSLSAQLAPLNVASQHGGNSTSVEGIQITKLSASQYNARSNVFRSGNQATTIRGRVPEGYRAGQMPTSGTYTSPATQSRYNQQTVAPYTQRIMRVVQTQPTYGNPTNTSQDPLIIQRVIHQPARTRQESDEH
ncbi:hypothetical protein M3Y94_00272700 [Aphelenchoides besseyi]|nr:hypothetical protein M3Y94_00272700 [Aphelenchoides besseyi]KAI6236069.1 hypothetical protein M3Y95_00118400 [Aphelenchoides besseyi]